MSRTYGHNDPRENQADAPDDYYIELTGPKAAEFLGKDVDEDYVTEDGDGFYCQCDDYDGVNYFMESLRVYASNHGLQVPRGGLESTAGNIECNQYADAEGERVLSAEVFESEG